MKTLNTSALRVDKPQYIAMEQGVVNLDALQGLRGYLAISVLTGHTFRIQMFAQSQMTFFFMLSGFSLAIHKTSIKWNFMKSLNFYKRRIRKTIPTHLLGQILVAVVPIFGVKPNVSCFAQLFLTTYLCFETMNIDWHVQIFICRTRHILYLNPIG